MAGWAPRKAYAVSCASASTDRRDVRGLDLSGETGPPSPDRLRRSSALRLGMTERGEVHARRVAGGGAAAVYDPSQALPIFPDDVAWRARREQRMREPEQSRAVWFSSNAQFRRPRLAVNCLRSEDLCRVRAERGRLWLLAAPLALAAAGCSSLAHAYKYKFTLGIRDQGVVRQASSVVRVATSYSNTIDGNYGIAHSEGEATYIRLSSGKYVFALLKGKNYGWIENPSGVLWKAYGIESTGKPADIDALRDHSETISLGIESLPFIVTFSNISDPNTVMVLDPENMEGRLGLGVEFAFANICVTSESITKSIDRVLPWLPSALRDENYSFGPMGDQRMPAEFEGR